MRHTHAWLVRGVGLLAAIYAAPAPGGAATADRIVAIVNDDIITESDIAMQLSTLVEQQKFPSNAEPGDVRQTVLRQLIHQRLILQEAEREKVVVVTTDDVTDRLEEVRRGFDSDAAFQQSLADAGISIREIKNQIRDQLMVNRVVELKVRSLISVSPQEVARELDEHPGAAAGGDRVRTSHILIRVTEARPEPQARELIETIHARLAAGADFSAEAAQHSEAAEAETDGIMGWVAQGELLPELDRALFELQVGELSAPVRTRLGFHLVRAEGGRAAASLSVLDANNAVYQRLYKRKYEREFGRWINGLIERAYIEIVTVGSP